jgi:Plavaka transposase
MRTRIGLLTVLVLPRPRMPFPCFQLHCVYLHITPSESFCPLPSEIPKVTRKQSVGKRSCPICNGEFHPSAFTAHFKKCEHEKRMEDLKEEGKRDYVNFKRAVWHTSFHVVIESIIKYSKTGSWFKCGDGVERWMFPIVLILSADYEEQCGSHIRDHLPSMANLASTGAPWL